jgi:hypothetical protein
MSVSFGWFHWEGITLFVRQIPYTVTKVHLYQLVHLGGGGGVGGLLNAGTPDDSPQLLSSPSWQIGFPLVSLYYSVPLEICTQFHVCPPLG